MSYTLQSIMRITVYVRTGYGQGALGQGAGRVVQGALAIPGNINDL